MGLGAGLLLQASPRAVTAGVSESSRVLGPIVPARGLARVGMPWAPLWWWLLEGWQGAQGPRSSSEQDRPLRACAFSSGHWEEWAQVSRCGG